MLLQKLRADVIFHRPRFDALTLVCLGLLLSHLVLSVLGGHAAHPALYQELGLSRPGLLAGKAWQMVTHAFLHGNWSHFAFNALMIYLLGGKVCHILGSRGFLKVFWAGVLLGALFHVALHPVKPLGVAGELPFAPLVGASGGAMALLLVLTGLSPESRMWPLPVSGKNLAWGVLLSSALLYLCTPGLGIPGLARVGQWAMEQGFHGLFRMAHACHFGGGLAGFLLARWILRTPITLADLQRKRAKKEGEMAA